MSKMHYGMLIALGITIVAGGVFGVSVLSESIAAKDERIYEKIAEMKWREERMHLLGDMRKQAEDIEANRALFEETILDHDDRVRYIAFLEQLAEESGVEEIVLNADAAASALDARKKGEEDDADPDYGGDIAAFDLEAVMRGTYPSLVRFLYKVENAPMIVHVREISMGLDEKEGETAIARGSGVFVSDSVSEREGSQGEDEEGRVSQDPLLKAEVLLRSYVRGEEGDS